MGLRSAVWTGRGGVPREGHVSARRAALTRLTHLTRLARPDTTDTTDTVDTADTPYTDVTLLTRLGCDHLPINGPRIRAEFRLTPGILHCPFQAVPSFSTFSVHSALTKI